MALTKARKRLFTGIFVLIIFGIGELLSLFVCLYISRSSVIYSPEGDLAKYEKYLGECDPRLGWPSPFQFGGGAYDQNGARVSPSHPDPDEKALISLYGDSFTWSDEVGPEEAWGEDLARLAGCKVDNYGVRGYGTDQAFLRYMSNPHDRSQVVVFNFLSENILRNCNQFRGLLYSNQELGLKPRYIVENGELKLIQRPAIPAEQYLDFLDNPGDYLQHEYFLPYGESGTLTMRFPFSVTLIRSFGQFQMAAKMQDKGWYFEFYEPDHPAGGVTLSATIIEEFIASCEQRGQQPAITVIPTIEDMKWVKAKGVWPYQTMLDELTNRGIAYHHVGPDLLDRLGDRDPCDIYQNCTGHFSPEGYDWLAESVFEYLKANNWLPVQAPGSDGASQIN